MGNKASKRQIYMQSIRKECLALLAQKGLYVGKPNTQNVNLEKVICKVTGWPPSRRDGPFVTVERYVLESRSTVRPQQPRKAEASAINRMERRPYSLGRDIAAAMARLIGVPKPVAMVSNLPFIGFAE
ncbi:hypothetical protein [Bordetella genomosp. 4]|uniref:Uncharacterized protein n=1 Tax=Bordetella genomosp. 4 TaxID=463044 RepID=A0A261U7T7_9BORD|nr:hypothetical protein [Bordetella genomosp. 4]OZI57651.1 hypothetical protein CAL20_09755 [Bordetella genomosp. 4]